jgi:ribonuclease HI
MTVHRSGRRYPPRMPQFTCTKCGDGFSLSQSVVDRYPGWTPKFCVTCKGSSSAARAGSSPRTKGEKSAGTDPDSGVFTDGSAVPNPGEGGWGAVYVVEGRVIDESYGYGGQTTNNRMELCALIHAVDLIPDGTPTMVYSDSNLAVRTINEWAGGWEKRGWKRKTGPVENVDLVKQAYHAFKRRPELSLVWIKAHVGFTWNEYADQLANRGRIEA